MTFLCDSSCWTDIRLLLGWCSTVLKLGWTRKRGFGYCRWIGSCHLLARYTFAFTLIAIRKYPVASLPKVPDPRPLLLTPSWGRCNPVFPLSRSSNVSNLFHSMWRRMDQSGSGLRVAKGTPLWLLETNYVSRSCPARQIIPGDDTHFSSRLLATISKDGEPTYGTNVTQRVSCWNERLFGNWQLDIKKQPVLNWLDET